MTTQEVWSTYQKDLKQFILSKVKEEAVADDVLQDVFIKIHTKLDTLKEETKLKSWVFTIARNVVMDYFKSKKKKIEVSEFNIGVEVFEDYSHSEKDCLGGIIKNLPKKYRTPLFLSDIKGMKQLEIANQLNLPLSTIKSQIQRARKMITKGFMDCCGYKLNENGKLVGELKEKKDCKVCS